MDHSTNSSIEPTKSICSSGADSKSVIINQPVSGLGGKIISSQPLNSESQLLTCPQCQTRANSVIKFREGLLTCVTCHMLGCTGLCWIPYFIPMFQVKFFGLKFNLIL